MVNEDDPTDDGTVPSDAPFDTFLQEFALRSGPAARGLAAALHPGRVLLGGRLRIVRRLGEGGMGIVFEAHDERRRSTVALKTLNLLDATSVYRLKSEFRSLAEVLHPNLCRLHELFAESGLWFFTMELIQGESFDHWVRPLGYERDGGVHLVRLRVALLQLLDAVATMHGTGKLHRDLKPSNVLVTPEGRVVVLDFGLASDPEEGGGHILDQSVSGTPAYMAPEQAAGKPTTPASDLYAVGVMLFEALTGSRPFSGRIDEILALKQHQRAPLASDWSPGAPPALVSLCEELLAVDPAARPPLAAARDRLSLMERTPSLVAPSSPRPGHAPVDLVGREHELTALRAAYRAACEGPRLVVVLLSGESGIGKSALLERFVAELAAERRAIVLSGRCFERESVPFKGFDALIDALCRHLRKLGTDARDVVPKEAHALRRLFPVLGRIDAMARAPDILVDDAFELRRRGFLALGELLGRLRERQPVVLAIDDLQWSDLDSTMLFLSLMRQADAPRVLLIGSHRSEGMDASPVLRPIYEALEEDGRVDARRIAVGPLGEGAAAMLVPADPRAASLLADAGGNPFLLRELSRPGAQPGRSLPELIRDRVSALPRAERSLLEVLSVAARPLPLELAGKAARIEGDALAVLDRLRLAQLLRSSVPEGHVECYHDRVREAVFAGLEAHAVRRHHGSLADALATAPVPDPEQLSDHYERAGEAQLAAEHAVRAAERATSTFAFDHAARLIERALRLGSFDEEHRRALRIALGDALGRAGRGSEAAALYLNASEGAGEATVQRLTRKATEQYLNSGRHAVGIELLSELRPLGLRLPETPSAAITALAREHARLRRRGLALSPGAAGPERHKELFLAMRSVFALSGRDDLLTGVLNLQVLRRALEAGNAHLSALALWLDIGARTQGFGSLVEIPALLERAGELIAPLNAPALEGAQQLCHGLYQGWGRAGADLELARVHFDRFVTAAHSDPRATSAYMRAFGEYRGAHLTYWLGRFNAADAELLPIADEARQRNDLFILPGVVTTAAFVSLAVGAEARAERELFRTRQVWQALDNPYSWQDWMLHSAGNGLHHHRGDARAAWEQCLLHDERFGTSFLARSRVYRMLSRVERGVSAAALAARTPQGAEREALLAAADAASSHRGIARHLRRWLRLPRAAAACARGNREVAIALLRDLVEGPRPPWFAPIHYQSARRRLGALIGGDEGTALMAGADAFLGAGGASDPESVVRMLLPGCEIRAAK